MFTEPPYSVPAIDFEVNHTDRVPGADVLGKGQQSEMWAGASFPTELPNTGCVQVSLCEQECKDVMARSCALQGGLVHLKAYGFLFSCCFCLHLTQFLIYVSKYLYEKYFLWFFFARSDLDFSQFSVIYPLCLPNRSLRGWVARTSPSPYAICVWT